MASTLVDPNLENTYTREYSTWFERELAPNFGVRTGLVMRQIRNQRTNKDANRPFSAFNVPASYADPGPDGRPGTGDDGPPISGFNLSSANTGLPTLTTVANQPDAKGDYYTWEVSGNRRMSGAGRCARRSRTPGTTITATVTPEAPCGNTPCRSRPTI